MVAPIISKPELEDAQGGNKEYGFGYLESCNYPLRNAQEDALAWHSLSDETIHSLTPQQIGQRLWTTYKLLDQEIYDNWPEDPTLWTDLCINSNRQTFHEIV